MHETLTNAVNNSNTPSQAYLSTLNPEQLEAVQQTDGPLLVLAGAGTGKTKVLTTRIAHILVSNLAFPGQILAVTFTNKAAKEMMQRVMDHTGQAADGIWLGTFHSIAARILRRHAQAIGLPTDFTILDTDDQIRLLKQLITAHHIDEKRWSAKRLLGIIQRWKDQGLTPDQVNADSVPHFADGKALTLYKEYQARLLSLGAADFGDLVLHNLTLFLKHPEILTEYQRRFNYILVDEYQDTNISQYLWLRLLAQSNKNICCVGDDDQSIYGWRGAEVGNILKFEKDFPGAHVIRLEQNYRSTTHILNAASALIAKNAERLGKTLWTNDEGGHKIMLLSLWDDKEEARHIGEEIEALQHCKHIPLNEVAILVRAGFQTRAFEEVFMNLGLPYRVVGGLRFYERMEIRDVIAYIRITLSDHDDLAFERVINTPKRGVGPSTMQLLFETARAEGISLKQATRNLVAANEFKPKIQAALSTFLERCDSWKAAFNDMHHPEVIDRIITESGYLDMWKEQKSPEAQGRVENIRELIIALEEFESIQSFLEHVSLVTDADTADDDNKISVMTLHAAKGLEFDTVFLPGWEEGLFPHQRAMDENGNAGLEEERRLAYVGITRAKKQAYISFAANRRVYNHWQSSIPSRFVDELPEDDVERKTLQSGFNYHTNRSSRGGTTGRSWNQTPSKTSISESGFAIGNRIFHQKFGYGYIQKIEGDQLEIAFDKAGFKRVIDRFVERT